MFNSGITIQVCRRHLFLLYSVASDRAVSTQPKMASKRTQNFKIYKFRTKHSKQLSNINHQ